MGAQQAKERVVSAGSLNVRNTIRNKPRGQKDGRQQGSNIFTEHSGKEDILLLTTVFHCCYLRLTIVFLL